MRQLLVEDKEWITIDIIRGIRCYGSDWMAGFSKKSVASLICLGFVHSSKMSSNRKLSF